MARRNIWAYPGQKGVQTDHVRECSTESSDDFEILSREKDNLKSSLLIQRNGPNLNKTTILHAMDVILNILVYLD